jgi:hypothetical protein
VEQDGASGAGLRGSGEIHVGLADVDVVTSVGATLPSFLMRIPGETLGSVWATVLSSSHPFVKVLLGTRRFEVLGVWWEISGGRNG